MEEKEELFIPKAKHRVLKFILVVLLIAGLSVGGYFLYKEKFNNPKTVITNAIESARKDVKNLFQQENEKYKINGLVKVDVNLGNDLKDLSNIIKNISMQFSGEMDTKEAIGSFTINTKYKDEKLVDFKTYSKNKDVYIYLNDLFDKYIKFNLDNSSQNTTGSTPNIDINVKDLGTIYDSVLTALNKELNNYEFIKEETKITIDGSEKDVNNNYIILKDGEINKLAKGVLQNLQKDNNFMNALKNVLKEDPAKDISDVIESLDTHEIKGVTYRLNIYTSKDLVNQKLVSIRQEVIEDNITSYFNIDKVSDNDIIVSINASGSTMSIRVKKNNSNINLILNANMMGITANIEINTNYEKIDKLTEVDLSNYKNYSDLTNDDLTKISENLSKNEGLLKLIEEISKVMPKVEA